ncbi:hypothetical protein EDC40_109114 [Aminobacter aminovorans]|uniref:Uncharacterized protein n=2 Tax=Aminobacter aminovorans TaxID=83263 RepID=A0A380WLY4_AMIAI|nr:hypothetical protein EDC40_109114 [Aminobacter aminovorans]SUU89246.1 Uncharacterised protein [Aminobacter aminovorans]
MILPRPVLAQAFGLTGAALLALATPGFAANATATQSTTKACSQQYQAAKTANTLNGEKWPQFLSKCSTAMNNTATPATVPAAKAKQASALAPANTNSNTTKSTRTAAVSGTTVGHQTTQQICSSQYQAAKAAGTLNGQKWPAFLSSCSASIKNDNEDASAAPPEPSLASAKPAMTATSADGKPLTAGEVAFRQRIHECSTEWQSEKQAGTMPSGAKWPQFWSQCNTKLKAQG